MLAVHAMLHNWPATSQDRQEANTTDLSRKDCHHKRISRCCFVVPIICPTGICTPSAVVTVQDSEAGVAAVVVAEGLADLGLTASQLGAFDLGVAHQLMKRITGPCHNSC